MIYYNCMILHYADCYDSFESEYDNDHHLNQDTHLFEQHYNWTLLTGVGHTISEGMLVEAVVFSGGMAGIMRFPI